LENIERRPSSPSSLAVPPRGTGVVPQCGTEGGNIEVFVQINLALINTPLKQGVNEMAAKAAASDDGALLIN
jgi:hypothetical protein